MPTHTISERLKNKVKKTGRKIKTSLGMLKKKIKGHKRFKSFKMKEFKEAVRDAKKRGRGK